MAIDIFTEKVISLAQAAKLLPKTVRNKKISYCTFWRWCHAGLKSVDGMVVRLEIIKIGGRTCTSQEALQRFFDRLSGDQLIVTPPRLTMRQRQRMYEQAEEELRQARI